LELFRGSCFHFLCLLLKSFPGSLSKHFHFLSSADSRSCPVRDFRECFWVYFFYFELRAPLPLLRWFLFHLYYHCNSKSRVDCWSVSSTFLSPVHSILIFVTFFYVLLSGHVNSYISWQNSVSNSQIHRNTKHSFLRLKLNSSSKVT
jgi:hypothetical protein